ncbi:MAG: type IV secretory system conjugative DNA transfer family protein [Defluviitaleaceae bacterium]|nr:type IV secretory system conjugative DNA transfer family protein [Defluviitaleaceae bacterium]
MDNLKEKFSSVKKKLPMWILLGLLSVTVVGYTVNALLLHLVEAVTENNYALLLDASILLSPRTYGIGAISIVFGFLLNFALNPNSSKSSRRMLEAKNSAVDGALENSRFMTEKERDFNFSPHKYTQLPQSSKDGVPVRAFYNERKKDMEINLASPMHGLIIGATGSGKTTTFINPMVQILGETDAKSSMILTDPKGELFQMHSGKLKEKGYNVLVLDLRDPYSSSRWNPLESIYDLYQEYIKAGGGLFRRRDSAPDSGLELIDPPEKYGDIWYEYRGAAYADNRELLKVVKLAKQKLFDEAYEDLNDLVGVLCPIESEDDPVWEKGARSIIMATLLAMLEDSENPELDMTSEKFNFFNLSKAISNSENEFAALKQYFKGRNKLSKAVTLSRQVMSAAEATLNSYMSIAFDKMSLFNDEGICALTAATDINPAIFAEQPTALFMKIPDEKDTRHGLAAVFILCIYKALIKIASSREDLSLPRNVYFILDEFGNMPKIDKFDKMITVGRSRKIWFNMVVQSYAQLNNVYGDTVADIVKSNCGIKMFIGSNDIETCKEFSELCGNMTVKTSSVSGSTGDKADQISYSTQLQTRPLIYPSELQKLNNKTDTGNAIIVSFGNFAFKTKFTPSYLCPLYKMSTMDISDIQSNVFFGEEVFYDLEIRNQLVLSESENPG